MALLSRLAAARNSDIPKAPNSTDSGAHEERSAPARGPDAIARSTEERNALGQWMPGNAISKAPRRSYVNLAAEVRRRTDDGRTLMDTLIEVQAGLAPLPVLTEDPQTGETVVRPATGTPTAADRLQAVKTLKIWGWGKEKDIIEIQGSVAVNPGAFDLNRLSAEDTRRLLDISRKARALPSPASDNLDVVDVVATPVVASSDTGLDRENGQ